MFFRDTHIAKGTCFFVEHQRKYFLITNWHNVTGKDPFTGKHLSATLAEPNRLEFDLFELGDLNKRRRFCLDLFDSDDQPLWKETKISDQVIDVCAIPVSIPGFHPFPINSVAKHDELVAEIGHEVFVVGYPLGIDTKRFPIWKRATIATEPNLHVDDLPMLYVDTTTAKGMSGSPVVLRTRNGLTESGSIVHTTEWMYKLLGVYSGRIGANTAGNAQLGIVWKPDVISRLLEQQA